MTSKTDRNELRRIERQAVEMAELAGRAVMRHWRRLEQIERKSNSVDLLTAADLESEGVLRDEIARRFPGHAIIGEEGGADVSKEDVAAMNLPEHVWIIDPIDGTTNFAHGHEHFAVSIGYWRAGAPAISVILRPPTRDLWTAVQGGGSQRNGRPIFVSDVGELDTALAVTGFGYDRREHPEKYLEITRRMMVNTQGVRRYGSAALDFCEIAQGGFDLYGELGLSPWDIAAGGLIVEEAGGKTGQFDGSPLGLESGSILATNAKLFDAAVELLRTAIA